MKHLFLLLAAATSLLAADAPLPATGGPDPIPAHLQGPIRIFIRSGPKSHGPGCHDHPAFLRDWTKLLTERGALVTGGDVFPTAEQLKDIHVMIIHRQVGGNFKPEEQAIIDDYAKRGGGFVVIHAGNVAGGGASDDNYRDLLGGSWRQKVTKWKEGPMQLNIVDHQHGITKGVADLKMDDEIYYDMDLLPGIHVLASSPTPKKKGDDFEIQTQVWTYEKPGAQRAFVFVPGHRYENFAMTEVQTLLLRGIAWAGQRHFDELEAKPGPKK